MCLEKIRLQVLFFACVSCRRAGIPRASRRGPLTSGWEGPVQNPLPGFTEPIQDNLHPLPSLPSFLLWCREWNPGPKPTGYKCTTTEPHLTLHNLPFHWFQSSISQPNLQNNFILPHPIDQMQTVGYRHSRPGFRGLGIMVPASGSCPPQCQEMFGA